MIALLFAVSLQAADPYTPPPELRSAPVCTCTGTARPDVTFTGYVIDAEVILGADKLSVEDRMATIFDVKYSDDSKIHDRTRVWHDVSEDKCGVTFDYGRKYIIAARWDENGELETDQCLLGE
jgi:hypothetical protein